MSGTEKESDSAIRNGSSNNPFTIVVVGPHKSGKTAFCASALQNRFISGYSPTLSSELHIQEIETSEIGNRTKTLVHLWDSACGASANLNDISTQLRNADVVLLAYDASACSIDSSLLEAGWLRRVRERTVARVLLLACKMDRVPLDELTSVRNEMTGIETRYGVKVMSACSQEPQKARALLQQLLLLERRPCPVFPSPLSLVPSSPDLRRPRRPVPPTVTTTIVERTTKDPIILDSFLPCCAIQ
jgi:GTPase SAR1 family protein